MARRRITQRERPIGPQPERKDPYEGCPQAELHDAEGGGWFLRGEGIETTVFVSISELATWARENRIKVVSRDK